MLAANGGEGRRERGARGLMGGVVPGWEGEGVWGGNKGHRVGQRGREVGIKGIGWDRGGAGCHAMSWHATPSHPIPCHAVPSHAVSCHPKPARQPIQPQGLNSGGLTQSQELGSVTPVGSFQLGSSHDFMTPGFQAMPCHAVPCHAVPCHAMHVPPHDIPVTAPTPLLSGCPLPPCPSPL